MPAAANPRITSIDALRGLTIAFMILVNDPGDWAHTYAPLEHAPWNGFTPTDLVFPTFLFLVGCSIVFSISSRLALGLPRRTIALQILRRAATLFALKMFLTAYPHFHLTHLRLFGVLTRIALCYLVAALLFLYLRSVKLLAALTLLVLLAYWILLRFVPLPGLGTPTHGLPILDPNNNLAALLDRAFNAWCQRWLHTGHLYEQTRDPEGLLSTLPALATTLLGIFAALWIRHTAPRPQNSQLPGKSATRNLTRNGLLLAAFVSLALGLLWNPFFPINKNLWTSSYVFFAGGWSLLLLALFFWLFDSAQLQHTSRLARALLQPLLIFGSNAITAFLLSGFIVETLLWIKVPNPASPISVWRWIYLHLFAFHGSNNNTSLAFALAFVALCFIPNYILWRRKLFLRI